MDKEIKQWIREAAQQYVDDPALRAVMIEELTKAIASHVPSERSPDTPTRSKVMLTLKHICENDKTTYRHNQARPDGKKPSEAETPGSIWLTPKEMANTMLASLRLDELKDAQDISSDRKGMEGWISVEEKLPEPDPDFPQDKYLSRNVLMWDKAHSLWHGFYNSKENRWHVLDYANADYAPLPSVSYEWACGIHTRMHTITHWHPLPAPPKEPK